MTYAYISRVEADQRTPSIKALRRIANQLGVTADGASRGGTTGGPRRSSKGDGKKSAPR